MEIYTPTVVQGGRGGWIPPRVFGMLKYFETNFTLSGKPLIFSTRKNNK